MLIRDMRSGVREVFFHQVRGESSNLYAELQLAANNDEGNDIEIRLGSSYMTNRFYLNQAVKNQRKRLFYLNQAITNQTKRGASNDIDIHKFRTTTGQK